MSRGLVLVLIMAVCLGLSYQAVAGMRGGGPGAAAGAHKPLVVPEGYEKVVLTVQFPGAGQPEAGAKGQAAGAKQGVRGSKPNAGGQANAPADQPSGRMGRRGGMGGGHGGACPQTQMNDALGLGLSQPHGCIVGSVSPNGPTGKAGVKVGDSIVEADGNTVTCPSTFVPYLTGGPNSHAMKLTVLRRKSGAPPAAGKPSPAGAKPAPKADAKAKGK